MIFLLMQKLLLISEKKTNINDKILIKLNEKVKLNKCEDT